MALVLSYRGYPFALLVLLFLSLDPFNGIRCSRNRHQISANKAAVINQEHCQSCPEYVSSLKDVHAYSVLKVDPRASLPSSFTICISVLVTTYSLNPLFTLLGSDGQPWFSAEIDRIGLFGGRSFYDRVASQFAKSDTIRMFPNQWVRICSVFNTSAWSNGLHEESLWAALLLRRLQTMHCL